MIEATMLGRRFGDFVAVEDVSLSIGPGEIFGFLGPNGAGKTTTVRMLACLIRPTSGSATVAGLRAGRPEEARQIRRQVGILTESPGLYDSLSAYKNLRFYADLYGVPRGRADAAIDNLLQAFGMARWKDARTGGFSRGMRQKLALARCLVHDPQVLFLDEPTTGLDPESARAVRDAIGQLRSRGKTVFLCTHNLAEAEQLCDRVAIISRRILYEGTPARLRSEAYGRKIVVRLERPLEGASRAVAGLGSVRGVEDEGDRLVLDVRNPETSCPDIVNAIVAAGGRILSVGELRHSMEDVYMKLVGDSLGT